MLSEYGTCSHMLTVSPAKGRKINWCAVCFIKMIKTATKKKTCAPGFILRNLWGR